MFALQLLAGCAPTPNASTGDVSTQSQPSQAQDEDACPSTSDNGPRHDTLGRLLTGPGLCRVEFSVKTGLATVNTDFTFEVDYELDLPVEAMTRFAPRCITGEALCSFDPCEAAESQSRRWTWDEHDRLVEAELEVHAKVTPEDDPCREDMGELSSVRSGTVYEESHAWEYDDTGRLATYARLYDDPAWSSELTERLHYGPDVFECHVETHEPTGIEHSASRHRLDDCGRVVQDEYESNGRVYLRYDYEYDRLGRLTFMKNDRGSESHWSYETAIVVASPDSGERLVLAEHPRGAATLWVTTSQTDGAAYELRFDERERLISIESEHELWRFSYDNCGAADSRTRWDVGAMTGIWTFPAPSPPGDGHQTLDEWTREGPRLAPLL